MKKISYFILIIGLLLSIHSCCTKKLCLGSDEIREIDFYNFSESELDTITIMSYVKNSNFSTIIDSFNTHANKYGDYFHADLSKNINTDLDYKINIVSTSQFYTINDFEIKKAGCNTCFPYHPKRDYYYYIASYQMNGQKQVDGLIKILQINI